MATALIHLDPKQKKRLQRRAKLRGKSFSQEVRDAVDLYNDCLYLTASSKQCESLDELAARRFSGAQENYLVGGTHHQPDR
jgi:Ribbon-helix-helix protein, copG family